MKRNHDLLGQFSNSKINKIFSIWFFSELVFNVLPIIVVLTINLAFGESFEHILLLPDWSFASVVLFGGVLSMFIELKTKLQRDSSHKVFSGTRFFTIALIASVISLTLALLREKGINIDSDFISNLQLFLFAISAATLLMPIAFKVDFLDTYKAPSDKTRAVQLVRYLSFSLDEADENIRHSAVAINKNIATICKRFQPSIESSDFNSEINQLENKIILLEKNLSCLKSEWGKIMQEKQLLSSYKLDEQTISANKNAT